MSSAKDQAEAYRLTLAAGLVSVDEVVKWADRTIKVQDEPSQELIELSLSGLRGRSAVISCLSAMPGTQTPAAVSLLTFELIYRALLVRPDRLRRITKLLERMYWEGVVPGAMSSSFMCSLDDELSLAELGIAGEVEAVHSRLKEFLRSALEGDAA